MGTTYAMDRGPALLSAQIQSINLRHTEAAQIMALIDDIEDTMGTFYVWNPRICGPQADPDGSILGSHTPTIHSVNSDNKHFSITGLPVGYVLTRGDLIAVDYASPSRRAVYRVVDATVTANGSGVTSEFAVSPFIRTGMAEGDSVTLIKPGVNMKIMPNTLACNIGDNIFSTISFQMIEQP
jgi:hypothetical protein